MSYPNYYIYAKEHDKTSKLMKHFYEIGKKAQTRTTAKTNKGYKVYKGHQGQHNDD